ncbi:DUF4440 domain-containing protein [Streptomyces sp. NPDC088387]|uniref:nuclear transport factor 2 family protein n=1 Tax=Streptomyces sp. NPDC088387 TaxID=3365859 RepID=UPI003802E4B4
MSDETDAVTEAVAGELRLMDPEARASPELARALLDPDFVEVGRSGRRWTHADLLAELPRMPGSSATTVRYEYSEISGVLLAPGLVHLTYETTLDGLRARRSSIWRKGRDGWRMYFHQATAVPDGVE